MPETTAFNNPPDNLTNGIPLGRVRWTVCAMLFAATSINYMDRQVIAILKPTLEHSIGMTEISYGYIVDAFQIAYAIGVAEPVSVMIDTFGTCKIAEEEIEERVKKSFDMRPAGIINTLDLKKPIYRKTAAYGHFGRDEPGFTWEITDKVSLLTK